MRHLTQIGDSIFDNGSYVPDEDCLEAQLRDQLGQADRVTCLAVMTGIQADFRASYRKLLDAVASCGLPFMVCTIYDSVPRLEPECRMALLTGNCQGSGHLQRRHPARALVPGRAQDSAGHQGRPRFRILHEGPDHCFYLTT